MFNTHHDFQNIEKIYLIFAINSLNLYRELLFFSSVCAALPGDVYNIFYIYYTYYINLSILFL